MTDPVKRWAAAVQDPTYGHLAWTEAEICVGLSPSDAQFVSVVFVVEITFPVSRTFLVRTLTCIVLAQVGQKHNMLTIIPEEYDIKLCKARLAYEIQRDPTRLIPATEQEV